MPTTPYAKLQVRLNSGAIQTGGITAAIGDTVDLSAENTAGWTVTGASPPRWEIVADATFTTPAGWTNQDSTTSYFLGVTPPQFTLTVWAKYQLRLIVNGGGGQLTDESTAITVPHSSGLQDMGPRETNQFNTDWTVDHRKNLRTVASGLGAGAAPVDAKYLTDGANGTLTQERNIQALTATLGFASSSVQPCTFTRTDAATAAAVTVCTIGALSSGTAANGFGVACVFQAEGAGGTAIDQGSLGFVWTDITGSSEDSKFVVQTRTAGAALATAFEVSGTAAKMAFLAGGGSGFVTYDNAGNLGTSSAASGTAHYWEDASTAVTTNGVATQNLAASLAVTGQAGVVPIKLSTVGVQASDIEVLRLRRTVSDASGHGGTSTLAHVAMALPNATGTETEFAELAWQLTSTLGPSGKMVLRTLNSGTMSDWLTLGSDGSLRFHGAAYAHNGYRPVLDGSGNVSASPISFAEVQTALASASSFVSFNTQDIAGVGALTAGGVITLSGLSDGFVRVASGILSGGALSSSDVTTALGFTPVTNARTLTAGAGLTGGGDLSANRTIDVATADASITVNPDSIEASGNFVAKNIQTTGSITAGSSGFIGPQINRASSGTFTFGSNITTAAFSSAALTGVASVANASGALALSAGSGAASLDSDSSHHTQVGASTAQAVDIGNGTITITLTGLTDSIYAGIAAVKTTGRSLRNTTAATSGVTVQYAPSDVWEGHAWISSSNKTLRARKTLIPKTSSNLDILTEYDTGGGSYSTAWYYTTATPSQFLAAVVCSGFAATQGTSGFFFDTNDSGLQLTGSNGLTLVSYESADSLRLRGEATGSTDPIRVWASGETKGSSKAIVAFGDGSTWAQRARIAGDGVYEGPLGRPTGLKTADYTAAFWDIVRCSLGGGGFTVKLPDPASTDAGKSIWIKNEGSSTNTLTLTTVTGSVSIDDASSKSISGAWFALEVKCTGTNGYIMFPHY